MSPGGVELVALCLLIIGCYVLWVRDDTWAQILAQAEAEEAVARANLLAVLVSAHDQLEGLEAP